MRITRYILFISLISAYGFTLLTAQVVDQPPVFQVKSMSFNSSVFSDIAPVMVKDGIIYCSDKKTSGLTDMTTFNDERLYYIYFVQRKDTAEWSSPIPVKSNGNPLLYFGPLCMAPDGKTVYFTSSVLAGKAAKKRNVKNPAGIFTGELSAGTNIINVKPFEYNSTQYSVAQPSVSRDGKYLFFASDMPGGQGKSDIYYCELINNKWSSPLNLGNKVNSPSSENYPFMHSSGRLYFSSNRPGGLGGWDIYYTFLNLGKWEDPVRMQADINSSGDDFAFVAEDNLQNGYFTSNRGKTNEDIFKFTSTIIRKVNCDSLEINSYCYRFVEENAVKFDTIPFRYVWNFGDGTQASGVDTIHCYNGPGNYTVRLDVTNIITNEVKKNEKTYELEIKAIEQPYISGPDICNIGKAIKLSADSTNLPGWNITQYYWNFGDESVATGKEIENKIYTKSGIFNIQLIVTAAPDATGVIREACVSKNINVIRQP